MDDICGSFFLLRAVPFLIYEQKYKTMLDYLLPHAAWINLNTWNTNLWEIGTNAFDDIVEPLTIEGKIIGPHIPEDLRDFTVDISMLNSINAIIDTVSEVLERFTTSLEEDEILFISSIVFDTETKKLTVQTRLC